jgi:metal-responsive CopG/Arc/MetJ family transcriptional regulator
MDALDGGPGCPPDGGIFSGMRVKTSVTIDEKVLRAIDRVVTREKSRSRIIEDAARDYLTQRARLARDSRDREIIDRAADGLNAEMEDVLSYQVDL